MRSRPPRSTLQDLVTVAYVRAVCETGVRSDHEPQNRPPFPVVSLQNFHAYSKIPDPPAKFTSQNMPSRVRIEAAPTEARTSAEAFRHHGRFP